MQKMPLKINTDSQKSKGHLSATHLQSAYVNDFQFNLHASIHQRRSEITLAHTVV